MTLTGAERGTHKLVKSLNLNVELAAPQATLVDLWPARLSAKRPREEAAEEAAGAPALVPAAPVVPAQRGPAALVPAALVPAAPVVPAQRGPAVDAAAAAAAAMPAVLAPAPALAALEVVALRDGLQTRLNALAKLEGFNAPRPWSDSSPLSTQPSSRCARMPQRCSEKRRSSGRCLKASRPQTTRHRWRPGTGAKKLSSSFSRLSASSRSPGPRGCSREPRGPRTTCEAAYDGCAYDGCAYNSYAL